MEKERIEFTLNGEPVSCWCGAGETLLQYLRGTACLRGAKNGCGTGHCGACTVLLDDKPVRSCVTRLSRAAGRRVLTIEGRRGADGGLHPIQKAFLDVGAVQCGFCTPGFLMSATALLNENPHPTREEIKVAVSGNLCRCTGYVPILNAIQAACLRLAEEGKYSL